MRHGGIKKRVVIEVIEEDMRCMSKISKGLRIPRFDSVVNFATLFDIRRHDTSERVSDKERIWFVY